MPAKIVADGIRKSYANRKGRLPVIAGIDLEVGDGEFVAIVGPSGCGKTTLLNILAGFDRPDSGSVNVDGVARGGPSRKGIVISQRGSVFPWLTVQQNLYFGLNGHDPDRKSRADYYLGLVGLRGFERGYAHELSGGMLKRVELARALVVKPEILYMDEPFSALDALTSLRTRIEVLRILEQERHTCVLITHDVEEAIHMADRIVVLSPRPATIQAIFDVPLSRPRDLASREVATLKAAVLREFGL
jgi:NitT/TauT family transport system ATP-binding protein/sulfonate transport system ATP-binding protein